MYVYCMIVLSMLRFHYLDAYRCQTERQKEKEKKKKNRIQKRRVGENTYIMRKGK